MTTPSKPTTIAKHSLLIAGHRTSISLEAAFWEALQQAARERAISVAALVAEIDASRGEANLSSAIRVHLFQIAARPASEVVGEHTIGGPPPIPSW